MYPTFTSIDTFDLTEEAIIFEWLDATTSSTPYVYIDATSFKFGYRKSGPNAVPFFTDRNNTTAYGSGIGGSPKLLKLSISGNTLSWSVAEPDGVFSEVQTESITNDEVLYFKSTRVVFSADIPGGGDYYVTIGSINPSLKPSTSGNFLPFFLP